MTTPTAMTTVVTTTTEPRRRGLGLRVLAWAAVSLACASAFVGGRAAAVDPAHAFQSKVVRGGDVALALSGLAVTLPSAAGTLEYHVSGRWEFRAGRSAFSGHDTIDAIDGAALVGATWVAAGAGDACGEALADRAFTWRWRGEVDLYGAHWALHGGDYALGGALGGRPVAVLCTRVGAAPMLVLRVFDTTSVAAPTEAEWRARLAHEAVPAAVFAAYREGRTAATQPSADASVRQPVVTLESPGAARRVLLAQSGLELALPSDGFVWEELQAPAGGAYDIVRRVAPALPETQLEVTFSLASECKGRADAARPPGLPPELTVREGAADGRLELCATMRARTLVVALPTPRAPTELASLAPLLTALVRAAEAAPPPATATTPPPNPRAEAPPRDAGPMRDVILAWFELEAPVSWRDATVATDGHSAPSPRVTFPSLDLGAFFSTEGGFVTRFSVALGLDLIGAVGGHGAPSGSPRYGGQRWETLIEAGYAVNLGGAARLGLTLGWHGLSGPLTVNSSLAASFYVLVAPHPDDFAFMLRVTPMQLVAANERNFLSPLTVEARAVWGPFAFGVEGQWIDAPRPGDQDIPARGQALIFRLGYGHSAH